MIVITWIAVAVAALVLYLYQTYTKLSRKGVNHLPIVPFFGNGFRPFFNKENVADLMSRVTAAFPDDKVVGMYEMTNPIYMVHDIETLKKMAIKDFDHFVNRRSFTNELDPTFGRVLFSLKDEEWRQMRPTLSPAFTSSKIRLMVPLMVEVAEEMIKVFTKKIKESGKQHIDVNLKEMTSRFANDVIATCAFGLKVESQSEESQFYKYAKDLTGFDLFRIIKIFFFRLFPYIAGKINLRLVSTETTSFFSDVVLATMIERERKNIVRPDMINILNEIKRGKLSHEKETDTSAGFATVEESGLGKKQLNKQWADSDLVAQAIQFLFAGFDTTSTAMSFIVHELATNPDVQDRLVKEIEENDKKNNGKFDFNSIQNMKYMDMVVSESLRLYPPAPFMDRTCVKDYNFGRVNKNSTKDLIVRKGEIIGYPIWRFHRDPKLFPNPEKFDPERFSEENSHNIKPFSYMPFGLGPRNCIGSRFALCEVKVMLYILLRNMKVTPCEKTKIPLELCDGFLMYIKDGGWVRLQHRHTAF